MMEVLSVTALVSQYEEIASALDKFFKIGNFAWAELFLGSSDNKQVRFLDFLEIHGLLIQSNLNHIIQNIPCKLPCTF